MPRTLRAVPGAQPKPGNGKGKYHNTSSRKRANRRLRPSGDQEAEELGCTRPFPVNSRGYWIIAVGWLLKVLGPVPTDVLLLGFMAQLSENRV